MAGVTGIGGLFFRARDPEALGRWYAEHLGLPIGEETWTQAAGPTVFAPFRESSDYFAADRRFMLNFRVEGLDEMIGALTKAGISVETRPEWDDPEVGRFARIHDPEGTPIELWEPPAG